MCRAKSAKHWKCLKSAIAIERPWQLKCLWSVAVAAHQHSAVAIGGALRSRAGVSLRNHPPKTGEFQVTVCGVTVCPVSRHKGNQGPKWLQNKGQMHLSRNCPFRHKTNLHLEPTGKRCLWKVHLALCPWLSNSKHEWPQNPLIKALDSVEKMSLSLSTCLDLRWAKSRDSHRRIASESFLRDSNH